MRYEQRIQYRNLEIHQIERVYEALKFEVPQLFFVKKITCQHVPILNCGLVIPQYRLSKAETDATLNAIQLKVEEIIKHFFDIDKLHHIEIYPNVRKASEED